jgi:hypothetical protein
MVAQRPREVATEASYGRYALEATRGTSYLATHRALVRKYPQKRPEELLGDLVATTPGDEGNRFAAARWGSARMEDHRGVAQGDVPVPVELEN